MIWLTSSQGHLCKSLPQRPSSGRRRERFAVARGDFDPERIGGAAADWVQRRSALPDVLLVNTIVGSILRSFSRGSVVMAGPQFFRLQSFARKANPAGQSVEQVLAEAARDPKFSLHVEQPLPPRVVFGLSPQEVQSRHDQMVADGHVAVTLADGTVKQRKVRKDRHTLLTCIASHPHLSSQIAGNADARADYEGWVGRNLRFFQSMFGERLVSVIEHLDEEHPHLHAFVLPLDDPCCSARELNPAWLAKVEVEAAAKEAGQDARAAVKQGNAAYRARARELQDEYHQQVGVASALTRTGPKRERLSRAQWRARKEVARRDARLQQQMEQRVTALVEHEDSMAASADAVIDRLVTQLAEADERYAQLREKRCG